MVILLLEVEEVEEEEEEEETMILPLPCAQLLIVLQNYRFRINYTEVMQDQINHIKLSQDNTTRQTDIILLIMKDIQAKINNNNTADQQLR
jgi:hypothetical protein